MKKIITSLFVCATAILINTTVEAKEPGYYELIENKTVLNLSESAEKDVEQDRIKAILRITKEAKETTQVQNFINKQMQKAVTSAKSLDDIKVSTGTYRVNKKYDHRLKKNNGWTGSQEIILDSKNKKSIFKIVQSLQKNGFVMSKMNYYLSRNKAASFRTELIKEALQRVQDRAKSIAEQLGAKHHHIGSINVSNQRNTRPNNRNHMMLSKGIESSMAAPAIEGSEERVSISISVAVILDVND